jgi:hypothetical protein
VNNEPTSATDPSGFDDVPNNQNIAGNAYGNWSITKTNKNATKTTDWESDVFVTFTPIAANVNSTQIGFVQITRLELHNSTPSESDQWTMVKGDPHNPYVQCLTNAYKGHIFEYPHNSQRARRTSDSWAVDRLANKNFGWFGYDNKGNPTGSVSPGSSPVPLKNAVLHDVPSGPEGNLTMEFETFAIAKSGIDEGKVYGGISWGVKVDANGKVTSLPRKFLPAQTPEFLSAVTAWNNQAASSGKKNSPNQVPLGPFVNAP